MLQANSSMHFGDVSPAFMCPVEPNMLDSLFPVGKNLLQRHGAAQVEELVVRRPPLTAVRRRGGICEVSNVTGNANIEHDR
jgi:hypothetical protein